uniref:IRS-type PTB domain-containing protein n=1 Tax=Zonotrichia albicollis TaxID=44394 RepID=A0A8D2QJ11_ZONAL
MARSVSSWPNHCCLSCHSSDRGSTAPRALQDLSGSRSWNPLSQAWGSLLAAAVDTQLWSTLQPHPLQPLELLVLGSLVGPVWCQELESPFPASGLWNTGTPFPSLGAHSWLLLWTPNTAQPHPLQPLELLVSQGAQPRLSGQWWSHVCHLSSPVPTVGLAVPEQLCPHSGAGCPLSSPVPTVNAFWVTVQRTEAAERCELRGTYVLKAERDSLVLKDPRTDRILFVWPYRLLRRYGRDKVMFSFEAGRRCDSGPGNFTFETKQGNEIFRLVEASIQEQKAQVEENRQSCDSLEAESPGMVQIRQALADSLNLELPDPSSVYSEPLDSVKGLQPWPDPLEAWRTQGHDGRGGYEYPYNPSTDDYSVPNFPAKAKNPKPVPAPKPQAAFIPKGAERLEEPGRRWGSAAPEKVLTKPSLNSSNNNNVEVLYSQVVKPQQLQKKEQCVDEYSLSPLYEDLGEI